MSPQFPNSGTVIPMGTDKNNSCQVNNNLLPLADKKVTATPSPPTDHSSQEQPHEDPKKKNGRIKRMLKKIFGRDHSTKQPYAVYNYNIFNVEGSTINTQNNISKNMNFFGPLYNNGVIISNEVHQESNKNEQQDASKSEDESDKNDHIETVDCVNVETAPEQESFTEIKTEPMKDNTSSPLIAYISNKDYAPKLLEWLHATMDNQKYPKQKLKPLRAAFEAGYFTQSIPYKAYIAEFGNITTSCYYHWIIGPLKYDRSEIDALIEQIPIKLP